MCSGHTGAHGSHSKVTGAIARQEGQQMADLSKHWWVELAKRNFAGAQDSMYKVNELGVSYNQDSQKTPFAEAFYEAALEVMHNLDINEVINTAGLDEQGKVFVLACYDSELPFLTRRKLGQKPVEYTEKDALEMYGRVAQTLYGSNSEENNAKVRSLLEEMDTEIEQGFRELAAKAVV